MSYRRGLSAGLFIVGLFLVALGFSALASGGGRNLCGFSTDSIGRVFAGECGAISLTGGALLLAAGAASFVASARLQRHRR